MKQVATQHPEEPCNKRQAHVQGAAPQISLPDEVRHLAPARATVNLAAIRHNARILQRVCTDLKSRPMPVLKGDAYGHGAVRVATELAANGIDAFATATLGEAIELRLNGIEDAQILVLGAPLPADVPLLFKYRLDTMISSLSVAHVVANASKTAQGPADAWLHVHLYVETGMTRLGLQSGEMAKALEVLASASHIRIVGICSHFAESDNPKSEYVGEQMRHFDLAMDALRQHPLGKDLSLDIHFGNSGALLDARFHDLLGQKYPGGISRPGIALYGAYPQIGARQTQIELGALVSTSRMKWAAEITRHDSAAEALAECMTLLAKVVNIMEVDPDTSVGYSRTWRTSGRCLIATLGIGYADGYPRSASNRAQVAIRGRYYPIAGNVCMDMTMINLGDPNGPGSNVCVGDDAILFGPGGLTASELAWHCGTIHYELLCCLTRRVQRLYVDDEEAVHMAVAGRSGADSGEPPHIGDNEKP